MMKDFAMPSLRWRLAVIACFALILAVAGLLIAQDQPVKAIPSTDVFPSAAPVRGEHSSGARELEHEGSADSSLRLGIGDLLEVGVYNVSELSTKTRVGNNGDIYLPLIDYVHVARSEEHTSELQSPDQIVCRLPLEKTNTPSTCTRPATARNP